MSENTKLDSALEQGEIVRWSGAPQPYSLFDESRKSSTIITLCWALAWGVALVGGYYASSVSNGAEVKTGIMAFCVFIPLFVIWMPVSDRNKIKKLSYAVTDKRVIVLSEGESNPISMPLTDIDAMRIEDADNGNCHIRLGSSVFKASARKLPGLAYRGDFYAHDGERAYKGLVIFNIPEEDAETVLDLLKPTIPIAEK
ncbi:MAG: hypothetical protein DELT_00271 [Desulfovibrio sp.]